jgi:ribosomal protein L7Ae-like RNA K-turn-binding protein
MSDEAPLEETAPTRPVERLFPFVLKTRGLVIGREALRANKGKLHFVLITTDIADYNREEVLKDFTHYPVVQYFLAEDLEKFFNVKGAKAVGFLKSGLAQSIYAELKAYRLNKPEVKPTPPKPKTVKAPVAPVTHSENP